MIRPLVKDPIFLSVPSAQAGPGEKQTVKDLLDTLRHHAETCSGMAANMIGVSKRIIAVNMGGVQLAMINPVLIKKSGPYVAEESCLSLDGVRKTIRYQEIEVSFMSAEFAPMRQVYSGYIAQVIQHEIDHLNGILI